MPALLASGAKHHIHHLCQSVGVWEKEMQLLIFQLTSDGSFVYSHSMIRSVGPVFQSAPDDGSSQGSVRLFLPQCHHYSAINISTKRVFSDRIPTVTNSVAPIVKKTTLVVALRRLQQLSMVGCPSLGAEEHLSLSWAEHTWLGVMQRKGCYRAKSLCLGGKAFIYPSKKIQLVLLLGPCSLLRSLRALPSALGLSPPPQLDCFL